MDNNSDYIDIQKILIIFSGYNQRAVITFLRTLEAYEIEYAIIANSKSDTIFLTKYGKKVLVVRKKSELDLKDFLDNIQIVQKKIKADRYLIAPSTEALNRFLLNNREEIERHNCEIPLVSEKLYESISDKYKFQKICVGNNILAPKEYLSIEEAKMPYVAKPKEYFSKSGSVYAPFLIFNEEDEQFFIKNYTLNDFYYQEFIDGQSFYLLYYFFKDGTVYRYSQENLIQQPHGKSILAAISSDFHLSDESLKYEKSFKSLGFFGLVMVEVKKFKNKNYMIEANPRFWGPSQLFVDAGVNFFEPLLYDFGVLQKKPVLNNPISRMKYFWYGGIVQTISNKEECVYHNYSPDKYKENFKKWILADIYNRIDTIDIFINETN